MSLPQTPQQQPKRVQLTTLSSSSNVIPLGPPPTTTASTTVTTTTPSEPRRSSFSSSDHCNTINTQRRSSLTSSDPKHANGHLAKMTLDKPEASKLNSSSDKKKQAKESKNGSKETKEEILKTKTFRFSLKLSQPTSESFAEYYFDELMKESKKRKKLKPEQDVINKGKDPFNNDEDNDEDVRRLAAQMEEKYGNAYGKSKRRSAWEDYVDKGQGYDETDPFIDNDEAYDELIPSSLTTKHGGFYVNIGTLEFKPISLSDEEEDDDDDINNGNVSNSSNDEDEERKKRKEDKLVKKKKVQREYPSVVPSKKKYNKSGTASGNNPINSTINRDMNRLKELKKMKKLKERNNNPLAIQAQKRRKELAASMKARMEAEAMAKVAADGPPQLTPSPLLKESTAPTKVTKEPILVDLEDEEEEFNRRIKKKKPAIIDDDSNNGHSNGNNNDVQMEEEGEDVPVRQSVIDVIESVARGSQQRQQSQLTPQLAVDKMTADQMAAAIKNEVKQQQQGHEHRSEQRTSMSKPLPLLTKRPNSLPVTGGQGHSSSGRTPTSTPNEGMASRIISNFKAEVSTTNLPKSPSEQLKALSASLLASRDGHQMSHSQSIPQSVLHGHGQRSKTPPAATLFNPKSVQSFLNEKRMKDQKMISSASDATSSSANKMSSSSASSAKSSSSLLHHQHKSSSSGHHHVHNVHGHHQHRPGDAAIVTSSLLDQVINNSLRGYGQEQQQLKQPAPAHQQVKSQGSSSRLGHGHQLDGNKERKTPQPANMLDALIQEQFNSSRVSSADQLESSSQPHTKIIKYKEHHRVPNLSTSSSTQSTSKTQLNVSKVPSPPIVGSSLLQQQQHTSSSASGKSTPPVMAAGIHRLPSSSSSMSGSNKPRPGPLSKKMIAMTQQQQQQQSSSAQVSSASSSVGMMQPQKMDMSSSYTDLYSKLMMSMGQYGQLQPNVPISINPVVAANPGLGQPQQQQPVHRPTNHSIEALVSPSVSTSSPGTSASILVKPQPVKSVQPGQGHVHGQNSLFTTFLNPQQQQFKK